MRRVMARAPPCISLPAVGQQGQQDRAREGDEGDDGQDGVVYIHRGFFVSFGGAGAKVQVQKQIPYGMANQKNKQRQEQRRNTGILRFAQNDDIKTNTATIRARA